MAIEISDTTQTLIVVGVVGVSTYLIWRTFKAGDDLATAVLPSRTWLAGVADDWTYSPAEVARDTRRVTRRARATRRRVGNRIIGWLSR